MASVSGLMVCLFTFARFAGDDAQEAQQADLIHGQAGVGPGCVQTASAAALLPGHLSHQHHVAPLLRTLLQPAHPGWGRQQSTAQHSSAQHSTIQLSTQQYFISLSGSEVWHCGWYEVRVSGR